MQSGALPPSNSLPIYKAPRVNATSSASKRFPSSAAPCRRAKPKSNPAQPLQEPCRALQEPCRALQDPEGFNPPYLPLTPRIPPSCPRRVHPAVLFFDLFFDRLPDPQKVTFSSQKKSTGYIRRAKNFSGASKNKNFPSSFGVFSQIRAGKRARVDFGRKNR